MRLIKTTFLALALLSGAAGAATYNGLDNYATLEKVEQITKDQAVTRGLKDLLGNHYGEFAQNFDVYGEPHKTPDGGLFVEGWLKDLHLEQASAFVVYPDGRLAAAYILPSSNEIMYYSTDHNAGSVDAQIKLWAERFDQAKIIAKSAAPGENRMTVGQEKPGEQQHIFDSKGFSITLTSRCENNNISCDKVDYTGIRKSNEAILKLTGKNVVSDCTEKGCKIQGYEFNNGKTVYFVDRENVKLVVKENGKVLMTQSGRWVE